MHHHHDDRCSFPIHQVILGGETGPGARPMHPDWVRSVRDQCAAAGVPFYFKGWGEWKMDIEPFRRDSYIVESEDGQYYHIPKSKIARGKDKNLALIGSDSFIRVGKKKAGRLLDGRTHDELAWRV